MENKFLKFPKNFIWGVNVSAYQVEGGNVNDWSEWEKENADRLAKETEKKYSHTLPQWNKIKTQAQDPQNYICGRAADHYNKFLDDIKIIKNLGAKAFRFSIEWSRVEPQEGQFDQSAINHYRSVFRALKANSIQPWVTLWHYTNPLWIRDLGGWENKKTVDYFLRYAEKIVQEFGNEITFWVPLNEPALWAGKAYLEGTYPPNKHNFWTAQRVFNNLISAQRGVYKLIRHYNPQAQVGIAHATVYTQPYHNTWYNRALVHLLDYYSNWKFLNAIQKSVDFLGLNYYTRGKLHLNVNRKPWTVNVQQVASKNPVSDLGWEIYPRGIYKMIKRFYKRYRKPLYILENGIADADDSKREQYIKDHLKFVYYALESGYDVRGYLYWSLLDNFEWNTGKWPRFGLAEVDYQTMERRLRPSAFIFADIIKNNGFNL